MTTGGIVGLLSASSAHGAGVAAESDGAGDGAAGEADPEQLLPAVLGGTVEPGKVFDSTIGLDDVPDGYRAVDDREALSILVRP